MCVCDRERERERVCAYVTEKGIIMEVDLEDEYYHKIRL